MWRLLLRLLARWRNVPERKTVTIPVGPLWTRGDLVKAPEGSSPKVRNCAFRRGVVEKRPGWLYESDASAPTSQGGLSEFVGPSATYLIAGSSAAEQGGYVRASNGSWAVGPDPYYGGVEYDGTFYALGGEGSTVQSRVSSFDGTTTNAVATTTRIGGTAIGQYGGRLLVGSSKFYIQNGGTYLFAFDSAAEWTVSGAWVQPTGATVRTATIANATTDTIKSAAAVYTTGASASEYVTVVFEIQAVSATVTTPIRVRIENAAGTTVYGSAQYVVSNATDDPEWRQYSVTASVPASTATYAALQIGNDTGGGTVGVTLRLSDVDNDHGLSAYQGRFVYPFGAYSITSLLSGQRYKNRVYFSEPLDFTDWRNENFFEVDEAAGYVQAIASVNGRVVVFKERGMWVYSPTESALRPFQREAFLPNIGCSSQRGVTLFDGILFFVGENEVYAFDGSSAPVPLCGDAVRDAMFPAGETQGTVCAAVDTDNRELWVVTGVGTANARQAYIYSIDSRQWIGTYELTATYAPDADISAYGGWAGLVYTKPRGETYREMWLNYTTGVQASKIVKLRLSQTLDSLSASTEDIVAEYVFHPLETPRPRKQMTVQEVGIDHKITASQAASETRYAFSTDGGSTFSKYNEVRVPTASGASTDTDPIRVPLHQTAPRVVLKITHTGLGGPTYFNMTGAEASIIVRGRETQGTNPTAVGSSL